MKKLVILASTLIFCGQLNAAESSLSLSLSVKKFNQLEGKLHLQVLDCSDPNKEWKALPVTQTIVLPVTEKALTHKVEKLPEGQYCVRFFQDLNANSKLDLGASSIPKEPVGFSNNPNLMFGQPSPDDSMFELSKNMDMNLKVNSRKRH